MAKKAITTMRPYQAKAALTKVIALFSLESMPAKWSKLREQVIAFNTEFAKNDREWLGTAPAPKAAAKGKSKGKAGGA